MGDGVYRQMVAIAGLLGASEEAQAHQVLRRLPDLAGAPELTVSAVAGWLRELYPATSSSWIGPIQPDLLLEYLVTSVFGESSELADRAVTGLPEDRAGHALTVLAQALDHYPVAAAGLLRRLLAAHADVLALPAVRLARNLDSAVLAQIIAAVFADTPISGEVLATLAAELRQTSLPMVPVMIAVYLRVGADEAAHGQIDDASKIAAMVADVAAQLENLGLLAPGAEARRAVTTLYRALERAEPGRYRADLATSLTDLGATLSDVGRNREAHPAMTEAVELYRALERAEPGRYRAALALALTNLGAILGRLGRNREAHPVVVEAVELYRALERAEPGRYHADLAATLASLGATLSRLGAHDLALTVTTEATGLYRALAEKEPAGYRDRLAHTLAALSGILLDLGRLDEAQDARSEADFQGRAS